jgi:hypothetical protein
MNRLGAAVCLTPSATTMRSARGVVELESRPLSAAEMIVTAPLGSALTAAMPDRGTDHEQGDRQAVDDQHRHRCHPR